MANRSEGRGDGPLLGLVRAVDREARRHVYGIAERPAGAVAGELGSLWEVSPDEGVPVWRTPEGGLATPEHDGRAPRRSPAATIRWIAAPAVWRDLSPKGRARSVARRLVEAARAGSRRATTSHPAEGPPAGYLHPHGAPGRLPLYSALHPVTGDQLLSTGTEEPLAQGYGRPVLLGHVLAAAPVTGVLGTIVVPIPWATRFGEAFERAPQLGRIEQPSPGAAIDSRSFMVTGWALGGEGDVSRVEILVDGRPVRRARLGMPTMDLIHDALAGSRPAAPIAGFETVLTERDLPPAGEHVEIDAQVMTTAGERFFLSLPGGVRLYSPDARVDDSAAVARRAQTATIAAGRRDGSSRSGLRVLAFTHRLDHGGAQRYLFDQLLRLAADGCECTVVAPADNVWRAPLEAAGIEVHVAGRYPVQGPVEYERMVAELVAWGARRHFDVAFVNTIDCFLGADVGRRLELPIAWKIHESFELEAWWLLVHRNDPRSEYARGRAVEALGAADAVLFAADGTRALWEPHIRPERAVTAPYGLELEPIDAYRKRFDPRVERARRQIPQDATVVLCLGTIEPRKGQVPLGQAFARIASAHPATRLALVGDLRTPYIGALRLYLARERLSSRFRIAPVTADPYAWHALADVFALASDVESSPISILEAMAFGTPVLATRVFGVPELITDGRDGYLCEPNDLEDLAHALDRVLSADPEERRTVAHAGEQRVRARHEPARYSRNLRRLLETLAEDPSAIPTWAAVDRAAS